MQSAAIVQLFTEGPDVKKDNLLNNLEFVEYGKYTKILQCKSYYVTEFMIKIFTYALSSFLAEMATVTILLRYNLITLKSRNIIITMDFHF